jgi:hypothetical protein
VEEVPMARDARRMLLDVLMRKVRDEPYPSVAILDVVEHLLRPDEVPEYVEVLVHRFNQETYPSMPLLRRIAALV